MALSMVGHLSGADTVDDWGNVFSDGSRPQVTKTVARETPEKGMPVSPSEELS